MSTHVTETTARLVRLWFDYHIWNVNISFDSDINQTKQEEYRLHHQMPFGAIFKAELFYVLVNDSFYNHHEFDGISPTIDLDCSYFNMT